MSILSRQRPRVKPSRVTPVEPHKFGAGLLAFTPSPAPVVGFVAPSVDDERDYLAMLPASGVAEFGGSEGWFGSAEISDADLDRIAAEREYERLYEAGLAVADRCPLCGLQSDFFEASGFCPPCDLHASDMSASGNRGY